MGLFSNRVTKESLKPGDHIYSWRAAYIFAHHGIYIGDNRVIHFTRPDHKVGTETVLSALSSSSLPRPLIPCLDCSPPTEGGSGVVSSCLACFLAGGPLYRFEYAVSSALFLAKVRGGTCTLAPSDPPEDAVRRAEYLLANGFGCYSVHKNNCEDFAIYCKTELLDLKRGTSGQVASMIGGPVISSALLNFMTSNISGLVASNVVTRLLNLKRGTSGQAASMIGGPSAAISSVLLKFMMSNVYGLAASTVVTYCTNRYTADIGVRTDLVKISVEDLTERLATGSL